MTRGPNGLAWWQRAGLLLAGAVLPMVGVAQTSEQPAPSEPTLSQSTLSATAQDGTPAAKASGSQPGALKTRPAMTPEEQAEALRISKLAIINGRPYDQPSELDKFLDYANDSYGLPAFARSSARALYGEARGVPTGWGTDWAGFGQRFGSAVAVTAINGNVRYGMELIFHEDLRYIPCHGCSVKRKLENAFLAEVTARHDEDGHRFFTLTPTIAEFSGPIIAHTFWYPGLSAGPEAGVVSARTVFATRIGGHLFREFVMERFHKDKKIDE